MQQENTQQLKNYISYLESLLSKNNIEFKSLQFTNFQNNTEEQTNYTQVQQKPFNTNLNKNELTKQQIERYSRQMLLEEIGYEGQKLISQSKVLVVGAGGIGAPALLYLAGMGVGKIGIIDDDSVEESNLHRQVIHNQNRVGVNKANSAKQTLQQFNQRVSIETYEFRLNNQNANKIFSEYDIILDASDNPKTRYLVNDTAIINKKILVSGSAIGWEGQLTVYGYDDGPCYRCLFPVSPKGSSVKSCGEAGVVGMIPGIIGQLEALEALKIILKRKGTLTQQLLLFDGMRASFKKVKLRPRQKTCEVCGENPKITNVENFDYDEFISETCTANIKPSTQNTTFNQISWTDFTKLYNSTNMDTQENQTKNQFIDVRFKSQHNIVHFKEFNNIPYDEIQEIKNEESEIEKKFNKNAENIFIMCRRGINSQKISQLLVDTGYKNVTNIKGGIEAYAKEFDSEIPFF